MRAETCCDDAARHSAELRDRTARARADAAALRGRAGDLLDFVAATRRAASTARDGTGTVYRWHWFPGGALQVSGRQDSATRKAVLYERFGAGSLHLLRERVTACAVAGGLTEDKVIEVALAVHELAANAVLHGPGNGQLMLRARGDEARCRVSDAGPGPAAWPLQPGHGLWLVHQVAERVAVSSSPAGFRVTAVFAS